MTQQERKHPALRILTPPMETPDPPNDTPGALKQVVLTPHDIPWSLRVENSFEHTQFSVTGLDSLRSSFVDPKCSTTSTAMDYLPKNLI